MDYGYWFNPGVRVLGAGLRAAFENDTMEEARPKPSRTTLVLEVVIVLMSLGAVTGNILVIVIVAATKTFHSVASVLIINLAISDLLVGIGVMPFVAVSIINSSWVNSSDLCLYVGYTSSVYCTASVLTLAAIALDRYYSIVDCLRYTARCTLCRICAVVLWIWLQALATSSPPLLGWSAVRYVRPMFSCAVNWAASPSYTAVMVALSFLLPAALILFCYVNIVRVARSHARRIHTLEDHLQRSRAPEVGAASASSSYSSSSSSSSSSTHLHHHHHATHSSLVYHLSGRFVSELRCGETAAPGEPASPPSVPSTLPPPPPTSPRRLFPCLAQTATPQQPQQQQQQQPPPLPQQHQNQHGVVRLFLVISAFFLCWTPYMGVALVQATETALLGRSSLVPPTAVTFSYWLVLLNSDINPLLYALLSKRFQGALHTLRQKIRARLGGAVGRPGEARAEGGEDRSFGPCSTTTTTTTTTTNIRALCSSPENPAARDEGSRYCSSVFTVNADFKHRQPKPQCEAFLPGSPAGASSPWQLEPGAGESRVDCLQVPSRTQEGSRLPLSAVTTETRATFFYGQITVTVEHDVC